MDEVQKYLEEYSKNREYGNENWGQGILHWVKANGVQSLLDVGCGNGQFAIDASQFIPDIHAMDIASVKAGRVINDSTQIVKYYDANANAIPLEDNAVEIVTAFDVLEHIPSDELDQVLTEMDRVSTKGMIFSIATCPAKGVGTGHELHLSVHNLGWWQEKLGKYGKVYLAGKTPEVGTPYIVVNKAEKPRVVVYTAIIGNVDNLMQQFWKPDHVRYVCFTDREMLNPPPEWEIKKVSRTHSDPKRDVAKYKLMPHQYLDGCDLSIWIDGNCQVLPKGFDEIIAAMGDEHDTMMFKHFSRDCTYKEAEANKELDKDEHAVVNRQMEFYRSEGLKENGGLPECNTIFRKHNEATLMFGAMWYGQIEQYSKRDQLSVMYAALKTPVSLGVYHKHARGNEYHIFTPHRQAKKKPKIVILCALHQPVNDWVNALIQMIYNLSRDYEIAVRMQHLAYLHKGYGELLGSVALHGVDWKPFIGQWDDNDMNCRDYDYLFFFENDMIVTPQDVRALIARDVEVVSALYVHGDGDTMIHHDIPKHDDAYSHGTKELPPRGRLYPVAHTGMGALLVKRGVVEQIEHPWFAPMMVRNKDIKTTIGWTGQDAGFCDRLRHVNIQPYVDPEVRVGHVKSHTVYPGDNLKRRNEILDEVAVALPDVKDKIEKMKEML